MRGSSAFATTVTGGARFHGEKNCALAAGAATASTRPTATRFTPPRYADGTQRAIWPRAPVLLELQPGRFYVDERAELVDVAVPVVVQGDVGRKVQGGGWVLRRERAFRVLEVVVAVDEDAGVLVGNRPGEALDGDVGEAQVHCPLDVQLVIFLFAARVQHDRPRLLAHADEFLLRNATRLAVLGRSHRDAQITFHVDRRIRFLRAGKGNEGREKQRDNSHG